MTVNRKGYEAEGIHTLQLLNRKLISDIFQGKGTLGNKFLATTFPKE